MQLTTLPPYSNTNLTITPIWLIDSSIYVFRAWFVKASPVLDQNGEAINAVRGFLRWVYQLLSTENPSHIAFAFDTSKTDSIRRQLYPLYKANRLAAPDNLKYQFNLCREFITALGLAQASSPGYEADDVIGTWVQQQTMAQPCYIISGDKDLMQLVREHDIWWDYGQRAALNKGKVKRESGVWPHQIADQLALAGDVADNIPGIDGIGMATAARILQKFNSLEIILSRLPEISQLKLRGAKLLAERIQEKTSQLRLNYQLTQIRCDLKGLPLDLKRGNKDLVKLAALCQLLGLTDEQLQLWEKI